MGLSITTLALARKYTKDSLIGLGAIKGAPCTIQNIVENPDEILVTFSWTGNDGSSQTSTVAIPTGADGKSLEYEWDGSKLGVRVEGDADFTYTDLKGDDGFSPSAKVTKVDNKTTIEITDKDGTTSAEVLDGTSYATSEIKPTTGGVVGEIVFNSLPEPGGYIGWVYTPFGWYAFGEIEKDDSGAFILADGSTFTLADGSALIVAES